MSTAMAITTTGIPLQLDMANTVLAMNKVIMLEETFVQLAGIYLKAVISPRNPIMNSGNL